MVDRFTLNYKKQAWWLNDKTIIELGSRKIPWFANVSPWDSASVINWSACHWQIIIFCSTSSNNCLLTNRLHLSVRMHSDNPQMTSKRSKNKKKSKNWVIFASNFYFRSQAPICHFFPRREGVLGIGYLVVFLFRRCITYCNKCKLCSK